MTIILLQIDPRPKSEGLLQLRNREDVLPAVIAGVDSMVQALEAHDVATTELHLKFKAVNPCTARLFVLQVRQYAAHKMTKEKHSMHIFQFNELEGVVICFHPANEDARRRVQMLRESVGA
jgi:hypothetical protein